MRIARHGCMTGKSSSRSIIDASAATASSEDTCHPWRRGSLDVLLWPEPNLRRAEEFKHCFALVGIDKASKSRRAMQCLDEFVPGGLRHGEVFAWQAMCSARRGTPRRITVPMIDEASQTISADARHRLSLRVTEGCRPWFSPPASLQGAAKAAEKARDAMVLDIRRPPASSA